MFLLASPKVTPLLSYALIIPLLFMICVQTGVNYIFIFALALIKMVSFSVLCSYVSKT